jgi:hypothetical protein
MAKIKAHTVTAPSGKSVTIFAPTAKLTPFLGELTPDSGVSPTFTTVPRKAYSRKQYPGDSTPIAVKAGQTRVYNAKPITQSTLPGENAYIEEEIPDGDKTKTDVTAITFTGAFGDLHQYCLANAEKNFILRSPGGEPHDVPSIGA